MLRLKLNHVSKRGHWPIYANKLDYYKTLQIISEKKSYFSRNIKVNLTQQEIIRQIEELELWQGVPQGSLKQRIHTPLDLEQLGLLQTKHQIINIGVPFHYKDHFDVIRCHLINVGISSVEIRRYDDCHMSDDCLVPAMWFSTLVEWYFHMGVLVTSSNIT